MLIYEGTLKESTEIHLELISNYSKVAGYKINKQKPITLLCASNEQVEFKIKNNTIYINTQKNEIRINLIKYV